MFVIHAMLIAVFDLLIQMNGVLFGNWIQWSIQTELGSSMYNDTTDVTI